MANESVNNLNEDWEVKANKPRKEVNLIADCTSEFIKHYLKVSSGRVKFAQDIMNSWDDIDTSTKALLSTFIASNIDKYGQLDQNKITIQMLRNKVWVFYSSLENDRNILKAKTLNEYDISPKEFDSKISSDLKNFDQIKLKNLINSQKERDKYLKSKLWNSLQKKQTISVLDKLTSEIWNKRFKSLSREDQIEVWGILNNYSKWNKISDVDLKILFDSWIFTTEEKQELVHTFIPTISLEKAIDINLIDQDRANIIKERVLKKQILDNWFNSSDTEKILDNISFKDVNVSTSDFFPEKDEVQKLADWLGFKNMSDDFNSIIDDYNEEQDLKWPQNLVDFKKELAKNPKHKWVEKLVEWSYIKITKIDKDWIKSENFVKVLYKDIWWKNKISLVWAWNWENISLRNDPEETSYNKFLESLNQENISAEIFTNDEIEDKIKNWSLKRIVDSYKPLTDWDPKTLWARNLSKLITDIDSLDPDWKDFWLEKWTVLYTKDWDIFTIWLIDKANSKITVVNQGKIEEWSFQELFEVFKSKEIKRKKWISNIKEFLEEVKKDWYDDWKWYEEKDWNIVYKESSTSKWIPIEYFTSKEWKLIKIVWSNKNGFEIEEWEFEETHSQDSKWNKVPLTKISLEKWKRKLTFDEFKWLISKNKLKPDNEIFKNNGLKETENSNIKNQIKWNLLSKFFANLSFSEIVMWWKMVIDWFTEFLKKWNDIHAAKAALALWKFLPEEFKSDLLIKVESSENEQMEKEIKWLWNIDSWLATTRIKEWIENKDIPEYKKEAWLMFMMEKYWTLTAKMLFPYRWKFIWYTAFWWTIWDDLYNKIKNESIEDNTQFTEEKLMFALISDQCKNNKYSSIKRRSRLYKEFDKRFSSWRNDEYQKWTEDASKKRTVEWRLWYALWEIETWTIMNALWAQSAIVWKGWTMEQMSQIPFMLLFSWSVHNLDSTIADKFKNLISEGQIIPFTRFVSYNSDIDIFNKTVVEVSKRIEQIYPDKKWIYKKAEEIFRASKNNSIDEKDKLQNARKFWENYGDVLVRSLNMLNIQDDKYRKTDKIIFLEKDTNPIFKDYYDKISGFVSWEWKFSDEWLMTDSFNSKWISGLSLYKFWEDTLWLDSNWWFRNNNLWNTAWSEIMWEVQNVISWIYDNDNTLNINKKRNLLLNMFKELIPLILSMNWGKLNSFNEWTMWKQLKKLWFDIPKDFNVDLNEIKEWVYDEKISNIINNLILWKKIDTEVSSVSSKVSEILSL